MKLRLNLRTLFLYLTFLCLLLGHRAHRATTQRRAVEWVRSAGGSVTYGYVINQYRLGIRDPKPSAPAWLVDTIGLDYFELAEQVYLTDQQPTNITPLALLKHAKQLNLDGTDVVDLAPLSALTKLETLLLRRTPISTVADLSGLRSLKHLHLGSTDVADVTPLAGLPLETLNLDFTEVRDVAPLAKITTLRNLDLTDTLVSKESYEALKQSLPACQIAWNANRLD